MLKKKICLFIFLLAVVKECVSLEATPYFGIEHQINVIRFKDGYGNNIFPKYHPQGNIYAGIKFNDIYGFEVGRTATRSKDKYSTLYTGDYSLGAQIPYNLSPIFSKSFVKINGNHFSIVRTYQPESFKNFRILMSIGPAFLKAQAERKTLLMGIPPTQGATRKFKKHKVILRLMVAPEYKILDNFGVRSSICFLNTSRVIIKAEPVIGSYTPVIRLKDSFVYSLGIFFEF